MKLKKVSVPVLILAVTLFFGLVGCNSGTNSAGNTENPPPTKNASSEESTSPSPAVAPSEIIEITFAHDKATTHPVHLRYEQWAADLEETTGGRVHITFYPAQSLVTLSEAYESVRTGIADISVITPSLTPGVFPMLEIFDLPVHYNSAGSLSRVYYDALQQYDLEELSALKVLNVYCMGPGGIISSNPIHSLDDLRGKQIRAVGLSGNAVQALGASPVSTAMPETYEALYRGVCDGVLGGLGAMTTWNLIEAADNVTLTPFLSVSPFIVAMNVDKWNSLPADIQEAIETVSLKYQDIYIQGEEDEATKAIDTFIEQGMNVYSIDEATEAKWMEIMQPAIDQALADREQYGPARDFYNTILELAEEYNSQYTSYSEYYQQQSGG